MCEDEEKCNCNEKFDGVEKCDDDKNEKVDEFMQKFHEHGLGCGDEIADVAKKIHPNALVIVPLYRSCIVIEQSEEEKKEGACTLHSYADPHWLGRDIDVDALKSDDFHSEFLVQGDRQGPVILNKNCDENAEEKCCKDEDPIVLEHDEN